MWTVNFQIKFNLMISLNVIFVLTADFRVTFFFFPFTDKILNKSIETEKP